ERRIERIESGASNVRTAITDLGDASLEVLKPIPVSIRPSGDDFVASFFDANVNVSGETEQEAFDGLREILIATFELFGSAPDEGLGPEPMRQFAVLRQFLRRK